MIQSDSRRAARLEGTLGLVPRQHESGESKPQLGITKAGDVYLRSLLVQCAQYTLGPFGGDSDLRRWGLKLASRGGKAAKKRATVAVARKLAVLLHSLWVKKSVYGPSSPLDASGALGERDGVDLSRWEGVTTKAVALIGLKRTISEADP